MKSLEDIAALGTIVCPKCGQVLDATNADGLYKHIMDRHADLVPALKLEVALEGLVDVGILRRVPADGK